MKPILPLLLTLCSLSPALTDARDFETVPLSLIERYELNPQPVTTVNYIQGNKLSGLVSYKKNNSTKLTLPFNVDSSIQEVTNGQLVKKGQRLAKLSGIESHHFMDSLKLSQTRFELIEKHYLETKAYVEQGSFKALEWIEISDLYLKAKMELEHYVHYQRYLSINEADEIYLIAPETGYVNFVNQAQVSADDIVAELIPVEELLIEVPVNNEMIANLTAFSSSECTMSISSVETISQGYFQRVWAKMDIGKCPMRLGQIIDLTPILNFKGFSVPSSAVIELNNQDYVLEYSAQGLLPVAVDIVGKTNNQYQVNAPTLSPTSKLVTSSASAVQGILIGLGD
jgi:hypothetical protein